VANIFIKLSEILNLEDFSVPYPKSDISYERFRRSNQVQILKGDEEDLWPPKSNDNWVEIFVVADGTMTDYHGRNLDSYLLTLLKIVSSEIGVFLLRFVGMVSVTEWSRHHAGSLRAGVQTFVILPQCGRVSSETTTVPRLNLYL